MCASMNFVQSRHRLHARSRDEMEHYVTQCEKLTPRKSFMPRRQRRVRVRATRLPDKIDSRIGRHRVA